MLGKLKLVLLLKEEVEELAGLRLAVLIVVSSKSECF